MKLSILVCSLEERATSLRALLDNLEEQNIFGEAEILVELDNRQRTTGAKRNALVARAQGEYIAFIDDDDSVSNNYIELITNAITDTPDVVGICGQLIVHGTVHGKFIHSLRYENWQNDINAGIYTRNPNHLNPVKRAIAIDTPFPDLTRYEDKAYSDDLIGKLHTEVMIEQQIYYYRVG